MAKVAGAEMVVNALPVGRDGGASSGVISNGAVADEVIRDDAVHDGEPPLKVLGKKVMYQEQGGADFAVTQVALEDVATGNHFAVHYASVKGARPGAVCVAERDGRVLLARHWRGSTGTRGWVLRTDYGPDDCRWQHRRRHHPRRLHNLALARACLIFAPRMFLGNRYRYAVQAFIALWSICNWVSKIISRKSNIIIDILAL